MNPYEAMLESAESRLQYWRDQLALHADAESKLIAARFVKEYESLVAAMQSLVTLEKAAKRP